LFGGCGDQKVQEYAQRAKAALSFMDYRPDLAKNAKHVSNNAP
jgi:hypothetical protein